MNYALIGIFFAAALIQTIRKGPGSVFAYVYLPVLLLMSTVRPIAIDALPIPDITSPVAVSYGLVIGMLVSGRLVFFRPHLVDYLVVLCSVSIAVTGYLNAEFWTLVSALGSETLRWLIPYYMARIAFRDPLIRRQMGLSLCFVAMAMGVIGMIEFRLFPLFFSRMLESLNMASVTGDPAAVLGRVSEHLGLAMDAVAVREIAEGPVFRRHSKFGSAFSPEDRRREQAEAAAAHGEEIAYVAGWARAVAETAGIELTLPRAIGG